MNKIVSLANYTKAKQADLLKKYPNEGKEIRRSHTKDYYNQEWRDEVVKAFNNGADIHPNLYRHMDNALKYRILRTPRALRSDEVTHRYNKRVH